MSKYGELWSRDELILALYLYCQIPFGQATARNGEVQRLAHVLGRTPASVARKLGNFGAFDPQLQARGVRGLTHVGRRDREIWDEFHSQWDKLVAESQRILVNAPIAETISEEETPKIIAPPRTDTERLAEVITRVGQDFFRRSVLASYNNMCCFCGMQLRQMLVASHIIPWSVSKETRVDPQNGLSLCALHDRAYDRGLVSVEASGLIVVSGVVHSSQHQFTKDVLSSFHRRSIIWPKRFAPRQDFLSWHLRNRYLG